MGKIIIHTSNVPDWKALKVVDMLIKEGLVSDGPNGSQYCFASVCNDGTSVFVDKTKSGTHVFRVTSS